MTVSTTTNKVSYIGNGIATEFAIPFPFLETSHLKVFQLLNDIQTERTDWTVSGGDMVFETAPEDGARIIIIREVPLTQETDYRENEILAAETLERNFDSLTMQIQQLKEQTDRAITVDVFDDTQAAELLPSIRTLVSNAAEYAATAIMQAGDAGQSARTAAEQALIATNKALEILNTATSKANKDFSNVSDENARRLVGNRIWISEPYNLSSTGITVIPHNLGLSEPMKATAIPYAQFVEAVAGYEAGEITPSFFIIQNLYTPNGVRCSCDSYPPFLRLTEETVEIPKALSTTAGIFTYNKATGNHEIIPSGKVRIIVKITY